MSGRPNPKTFLIPRKDIKRAEITELVDICADGIGAEHDHWNVYEFVKNDVKYIMCRTTHQDNIGRDKDPAQITLYELLEDKPYHSKIFFTDYEPYYSGDTKPLKSKLVAIRERARRAELYSRKKAIREHLMIEGEENPFDDADESIISPSIEQSVKS